MAYETQVQPVKKTDLLVAEGCLTGAFIGEGVPLLQDVRTFAATIQKPLGVVMWYHAFVEGFVFPKDVCARFRSAGSIPFIRLEPWSYIGLNDFTFSLEKIARGDLDQELMNWARGAREYGSVVLHSFGHEMNVSIAERWYPWAGDSVVYKAAFSRIREVFRNAGADNVRWIYSVNEYNPNLIREYYPGDDLVDYVGIDGFNFGDTQSWSHWRPFEEIFYDAYHTLRLVAPGKPVILTEFGCAEIGGDKALWLADAFHALKYTFTGVKAFVWFNHLKEADWRVNSTEDSMQSFVKAVSDPYFIGRVPG